MRVKKEVVNVIFKNNLEALLKKAGLLEDFKEGRISCYICGQRLNFSNLGLILVKEGKLIFVCDNPDCIEKVMVEI